MLNTVKSVLVRCFLTGSSFRHASIIGLFARYSYLRVNQSVGYFQGLLDVGLLTNSAGSLFRHFSSCVTMHQPEKGDVFEYTIKDYEHTTNTWAPGTEFELSKFDQELHKRWDAAMKSGAFRYDIDHITTRIIPGPKHYVAQLYMPYFVLPSDKLKLNLLRAKERRKPQDIRFINQPFNSKQFNFSWVGPEELIFNLRRLPLGPDPPLSKAQSQVKKAIELENNTEGKDLGKDDAKFQAHSASFEEKYNSEVKDPVLNGICSQERHALVINVSPMEYGHCLLVPQIDSCLPQIVTETSLVAAMDLILLSKHRGYRLGFNSLCAFASVNHLHYHAFYLEHELVVEHCPVAQLAGPLYEITTMPVPGFAFQLHGWTVEEVSRQVHKVCNYFQETDIAHNMFICRGSVFGECRGSTKTTVRVYVWPRRKFVGTKSSEEFNVASIELGGHLPIRELEGYHSLTEEYVDAIIADSQLPEEHYAQIKKHVIGLFSSSSHQESEQK